MQVPAAPWRCRFAALLWWRPPDRAGRARITASVPDGVRRGAEPAIVAGAWVRYLDTPVGGYSEVAALVGLAVPGPPLVHVPFLAVDSPAGLAGGRANWALPKTLARFDGDVGGPGPLTASGAGWSLRAQPGWCAPPVPVPLLARLVQQSPAGPVVATLGGMALARATRADVEVSGRGEEARWLPAGRCWAAVARGRFTLGPTRPG